MTHCPDLGAVVEIFSWHWGYSLSQHHLYTCHNTHLHTSLNTTCTHVTIPTCIPLSTPPVYMSQYQLAYLSQHHLYTCHNTNLLTSLNTTCIHVTYTNIVSTTAPRPGQFCVTAYNCYNIQLHASLCERHGESLREREREGGGAG